MTRIERENWWPDCFATTTHLTDVLRSPHAAYASLPPAERDKLRQTQIEPGETVRLLGEQDDHFLVLKGDGVLGWVEGAQLKRVKVAEDGRRAFLPPSPPATGAAQQPLAFCEAWRGTTYLWGGITHAGIDCSAFTQRYYLEVLGKRLARNSRDQRRGGRLKPLAEITNHDLIFCHRMGGSGIHHVGVFFGGGVWHARLDLGVVREELAEFLEVYTIEAVVSY